MNKILANIQNVIINYYILDFKIYAEDFSLYEEAEKYFKENPEARAD